MFSKNLLLVLLIVFPVITLHLSKGFVSAQIDITDDEEADVEDLQPESEAAVVGKIKENFLKETNKTEASTTTHSASRTTHSASRTTHSENIVEDEDTDDKPLKPSPDADTTFLFTQPSGIVSELPAGKDVHFLVGFSNKGNKDFIVDAMDASFRYPMDFTFYIQNFSAIPYNRVVKPKQDISLYYAFYTSETYSSRPFGLVVNLHYRDADGHQYLDAVFNETITIVEIEDSLDGETFFLYILLAACIVLIVVVVQQFLVNFTKKKISSGQKIETGTQNHQNDVDYDWLPKETLNDFNKSPRRSERLSPRKSKAQGKNAQVSPKQSPKQATQRKVKRGARDE